MRRIIGLLAASCVGLPALAGQPAATIEHVVENGETLWSIAAKLDDPHRWTLIYKFNRDQIQDPSRIYAGQRLQIPIGFGDQAAAPQAATRADGSSWAAER